MIDFERSGVSWEDFDNYYGKDKAQDQEYVKNAVYDDGWVRKQLYSRAEARKLLFDYFFEKTHAYGWTPGEGGHFSADWDHLCHLLV